MLVGMFLEGVSCAVLAAVSDWVLEPTLCSISRGVSAASANSRSLLLVDSVLVVVF